MRLRVIDRVLIALSGLILLGVAALSVLGLMGITVTPLTQAQAYLTEKNLWGVALGVACALLALLGIYEVSVLFRRGKRHRGFISQRSENGEIAISVKTIESLVTKCAKKHGEIEVQSVQVEETRNGLLIKLRATLPSGMNIPLAVGTLQKQLKQYITACSGVDVSEVRVKVDSTEKAASGSPYAVPDEAASLPVDQPEPAPMPAEAAKPVEVPAEMPESPADEEARELLTHQRLFAAEEEPALVPEPPVEEPELPPEEAIEAEEALPSEEEFETEAEEAAIAQENDPRDEAAWDENAPSEEQLARWEELTARAEALEEKWAEAAPEAEEADGEDKTTEE